jgi:hypothetical protein
MSCDKYRSVQFDCGSTRKAQSHDGFPRGGSTHSLMNNQPRIIRYTTVAIRIPRSKSDNSE